MASNKYYPEDVLVEKIQSGEYGWLEYVNHHSAEDVYKRQLIQFTIKMAYTILFFRDIY